MIQSQSVFFTNDMNLSNKVGLDPMISSLNLLDKVTRIIRHRTRRMI